MMKEELLETWEDFERELVAIDKQTKILQQQKLRHRMGYPLYRGVTDSKYHLESTLDRIHEEMSFSDYREIIKRAHKHIATCTGKKWKLVEEDLVEAEGCKKINLGKIELPLPYYEFMAYLRHNGFPSPLVDWTKSPYIAAFFAFRNINSKVKDVSIFVHMGKFLCGQDPCIWILGPTIVTDHKHYLQQSQYSICYREMGNEIYYANHEDVKEDVEETILIKYTIPISEREKVLRKLDSMNITAYSLFGSESSLMETLAMREICFEKWDRLLDSENE
jgi:hypothetical protein